MTFAEELIAAAQPQPIESHPFVVAVRNGEASRESIRTFALRIASATESFVRSLYAILSICTDTRVRHSLIGNVLEEEGAVDYTPGRGATFDPTRHHPSLGRRFAAAAGVTAEDIDRHPIGWPRWFRRQIQDGKWIGPFSYVAIGTEANIPPTYRQLIPALADHYGFSDDALEFLIEHVTADDRHGMDGAMLIASVANDDATRHEAIEGARRGGRGWWEILRRHVEQPVLSIADR